MTTKKILITGNGFDLALGLPTSYPEFIAALMLLKSSKDGFIDYSFMQEIKYEQLKNDYQLEDKYNLSEIKNDSRFEENVWVGFFTKLSVNNDGRWVDFERDIHLILGDLKHLQFNITNIEKTTNNYHEEICKGGISKNIDDVHIHEASFCRLRDILGWQSDRNSVDLRKEGKNTTTAKIIIHLHDELEIFIKFFRIYLKKVVMRIFNSKKFQKIKLNPDVVVTFNYTTVAKELGYETEYLHGNIDDNNLILGVDSVDDIIDEMGVNALLFTKYYQAISKKTYAPKFKYDLQSSEYKDHHYFFYGHSFDISDKAYINGIFIFAVKFSRKITIYYHTENAKLSIIKNLLDPKMLGRDPHLKIESLIAQDLLKFELIEDIIHRKNQKMI